MKRREVEPFSLSFLDAIACGFGAIILLLVLVKTAEPMVLETTREDLEGLIAALQQELMEIRGETEVFNRTLNARREQESDLGEQVARLQRALAQLRSRTDDSAVDDDALAILEDQILAARQSLNEVQARQNYRRRFEDTTVGGIPVDSEYIIFVIDTSGSMQSLAWGLLQEKIIEVLDVYPTVKGIQIMNDMGGYMFPNYAGKWIPDTPARRRAIISTLRDWAPFSNSSPVEGITKAISTYYAPDKKISLYVFGDEFTGRSIQDVVDTVSRINRLDVTGKRRVRIHAVGFPTALSYRTGRQTTGIRFASLMRALCEDNGGTFVGLNTYSGAP